MSQSPFANFRAVGHFIPSMVSNLDRLEQITKEVLCNDRLTNGFQTYL